MKNLLKKDSCVVSCGALFSETAGRKTQGKVLSFFCLLILALLESVNAEILENEKTRKEESLPFFLYI